MAEINNTQWLEEYLKMWTPKERMGRIHKVTTFDPTYHCYPEGVYLLDDDCRAHTAIYVVDKNHNVHIIYDGMAWDLLARAVEEGANSIVLQLEKGNKSLADILNEMLKAHNTCCAGLQEKLKRIGDQLERIGNNTDGINGDIKRIADSSESIKDDIKRIADKINEGGGTITPSKKTLLLAEPDRHEVTEEKKVYTSAITSIVKDVPEQPWTITDDFATYPSWATVSTDKGHVYITTDGSKPGKGKNDPWNIEPEPKPEKKTLLLAEPDRHEVTEDKKVYTSAITSIVKDVPEQRWTITDDFATYPEWATVSTDKGHVYITTDGSKPGKGKNDPWNIEPDPEPEPNPEPEPEPEDKKQLVVRYESLTPLSDITPGGYSVTRYTYEKPSEEEVGLTEMYRPLTNPLSVSMNGESKLVGPRDTTDWLIDIPLSATNIGWDYTAPMKTRTRTGREYEIQPLLHIYSYSTLHTDGTRREIKDHSPRDLKLPVHFSSAKEIYPEGFPMNDGVVNLQINYWSKPQAERILRGEQPKNVFLALFLRDIPSDATYKGAIELSFTSPSGSKETQTVSLQDAMDDPTADNASFCIPASTYRGEPNTELHDYSETKDISFRITEPLSFSSAGVETPLVAKVFKRLSTMLQGMDAHLEDLPASFATGDDLMEGYWYTSSYVVVATPEDMKKIEEGTYFTDHEFTL